ncbi:MAG: TraX family protein [Eubacteriales bacterium]|nr:TraX family protein [Eubacteriales bacterium]
MSALALKLIALAAMLLDHIGYLLGSLGSLSPSMQGVVIVLRMIGRIAFPIFAFQIAQGYRKTSNVYKYGLRLLAVAIVSQIPYALFKNSYAIGSQGVSLSDFAPSNWFGLIQASFMQTTLNICFTLFLGLFAIYAFDKLRDMPIVEGKNRFTSWCYKAMGQLLRVGAAVAIGLLAPLVGAEYGLWGVMLMVGLYAAKENKTWQVVVLAAYAILYTLSNLNMMPHQLLLLALRGYSLGSLSLPEASTMAFWLGGILAAVPLAFYDGSKRGKKCQWLTYAFYPVHLLLLTILFWVIAF